MNNNELLTQCIEYFKAHPGFRRVFLQIMDKYRSLGTTGGIINLDKLTREEKEALSGLLKKDYYSKKNASIKVDKITSALETTKFQGVNFEDVLRGYFDGNLISKKEEREHYQVERESFYNSLMLQFQGTRASDWIKHVHHSRSNAYLLINKKYEENRTQLFKNLIHVCNALNTLPMNRNDVIRLALFASKITKNPHCFDCGTECEKLLIYGIAYLLNEPVPQNAENKAELLYSAGIIQDEISNFTICSGLRAYRKDVEREGWAGFYKSEEPILASLYNLSSVDSIVPTWGKVFVFENPTVFTEVLRETCSLKPSLVCTYGQLKLSSLILLDRLALNADFIFYSGDFDPEGLTIADKLKGRYGDKLVLWRYSSEDYFRAISNERINEVRLKKLTSLKCKDLKLIAQAIFEEKWAAYQELIIDEYVYDIKKIIGIKE